MSSAEVPSAEIPCSDREPQNQDTQGAIDSSARTRFNTPTNVEVSLAGFTSPIKRRSHQVQLIASHYLAHKS